ADAHAVLPVAIERRDRALARIERVLTLTETRSAPRLANHGSSGAERVRDRLAAKTLIGPLDLAANAAGSRKHLELARGLGDTAGRARANDERGLQQVVVAAVRARSDQRLVERQTLARDFFGGKRVARAEWLGNRRRDARQIEHLVDLVHGVDSRRDRRIRQI